MDRAEKILDPIKDDMLLHLAIHIGFVCSLREGEVAGIDLKTIDLKESSLWIVRQVQRVSDAALKEISKAAAGPAKRCSPSTTKRLR